VSNERKTDKRLIGKDLEGNGRGLIEVMPRQLPKEAEINHNNKFWEELIAYFP
jgi:hypothetical protein